MSEGLDDFITQKNKEMADAMNAGPMSERERFALAAMQGILSGPCMARFYKLTDEGSSLDVEELVARMAYRIADEMLCQKP